MLAAEVEAIMAFAPDDAVLSIRLTGAPGAEHWRAVSPSRLRALQPGMTVEVVPAERVGRHGGSARPADPPDTPQQFSLL
jgi:hypothetical protein